MQMFEHDMTVNQMPGTMVIGGPFPPFCFLPASSTTYPDTTYSKKVTFCAQKVMGKGIVVIKRLKSQTKEKMNGIDLWRTFSLNAV